MTQFRFIYVIFALTAVLVFTVHLRTITSRALFKLRVANQKQAILYEVLGHKTIDKEELINPAAISQKIKQTPAKQAQQ
jgi:hypothetical protein